MVLGLVYVVLRHFKQYLRYIVVVSFIGGGEPEDPEITPDLSQVTDKHYNIMLYTNFKLRNSWRQQDGYYDRLELYDNQNNGELNLKVKSFTRTDEGYYRCISNVNGIAVESDLQVYIRSKLA